MVDYYYCRYEYNVFILYEYKYSKYTYKKYKNIFYPTHTVRSETNTH